MMLAPIPKMKPLFAGWNRVECRTVSEVENCSRRMAAQGVCEIQVNEG